MVLIMVASLARSKAIAVIQEFEKCFLSAYLDPVGIWTCGWGSTGADVDSKTVWTQEEADKRMHRSVAIFDAILSEHVRVALNDNQRGALISFMYNVGLGAKNVKDGFLLLKSGQPSTMYKKLSKGDYLGAAGEFPKWVHGGGKVLNGLVRRRAVEQALFLTT